MTEVELLDPHFLKFDREGLEDTAGVKGDNFYASPSLGVRSLLAAGIF